MSSTFLQEAEKSFPNKVHVTQPDVIDYLPNRLVKGEEGKDVLIMAEADRTSVSADGYVGINAQTSVPTNLGGAVIDFRPQEGILQRFSHMFLRISLQNSSGASLTIVPSQFMCNFIQIYGQNGNQLLYQTFGSNGEIFFENLFYNYDDWILLAPLVGSNAAYSTAGIVIANTASVVTFIPLTSMLSSAHLYLQGLKDQLLIRFTFQPASLLTIAGAQPTVTNIQLVARGAYESQAVQQVKTQLYRGPIGLDFPFLATQRYNFATALTNSTTYNFVLSGLSGLTACIIILFNALPITAANIGSYVAVTSSYQILSQNGDDLTGYFIKSTFGPQGSDDNVMQNLLYLNNQMILNSNFIFNSWARSPGQDIITGSASGFCAFNSFQQLRINTNSTFAAGNYQITVIARTYETLKVRNGILSVSRV